MCISCGCKKYNESHGDERNITVDTLQRSADASNMRLNDVIQAMAEGCEALAHGAMPASEPAGQAVEGRLRSS
jgi:hypothetical protein